MIYHATLFHPDGDFVTDFYRDDKQEIWECVADMGSKWVFYPIIVITTDKAIVDTTDDMKHWNHKHIKTFHNYLKKRWEEDAQTSCDHINNGYPLSDIY